MLSIAYSGTPLIKKLGIRPGMKVQLINAPYEYFDWLGTNITDQLCTKNEIPDFVHLFAETRSSFEKAIKKIQRKMKPVTVIWISWYKKSSGVNTDLTE